MGVTGVDYTQLQASPTLLAGFTNACKTSIATAAGVPVNYVTVTLSAGSVVVNAVVYAPAGTNVANVKSTLETAAAGNLASSVSNAVSAVPNINSVVTAGQTIAVQTPVVADPPTTTGTPSTTGSPSTTASSTTAANSTASGNGTAAATTTASPAAPAASTGGSRGLAAMTLTTA